MLTTLFCVFIILQLSFAQNLPCPPSSCGNIPNISSPFRLTNDPPNCAGDSRYELTCENNTTLVTYLANLEDRSSHKYIVQEINYSNHTIRLDYPSIVAGNNCSLPDHSVTSGYPYNEIASFVTFISCPYTLNNSSFLLELDSSSCDHKSNNDRNRSTYIKVGDMNGSCLMDKCRIDLVLLMNPMSLDGGRSRVVSLSEIHTSLLHGFELSWYYPFVSPKCKASCFIRLWTGRVINRYSITHSLRYFKRYPNPNETLTPDIVNVYAFLAYCALRIILGVSCALCLLIYVLRRWYRLRQLSMFDTIEGFLQSNNNLMPIRYSYRDIKTMTRNFRDKLGQGGYGSVYKGKLRSGNIVAVKLLTKPKENGKDFISEIATIGRIHHLNVVKLVGFYAGMFSNKRALIFDFMPNGSLEKYICNRQSPDPLSWERKYAIAVGVARGIQYLHTGCDIQILHFDIKPHNILLDHDFTPKISDFGLAKLYATDNNTVTLTAARGTIGYVAPELINRSIGGVSYKADVYSFGMLLMEMVGLNRKINQSEEESSQYFPDWIYNRINKGKDIETGDAEMEEDENDDGPEKMMKKKMTVVGLWCIQMSPNDRPSMSEVVKMLESQNGDIQIPPRPPAPTQMDSYSYETWGTEPSGSMSFLSRDGNATDPRKGIEMSCI